MGDMKSERKLYEISYLLQDPEMEKAVTDAIAQYEGTIAHKTPAKPIKLAYPIRKHSSAFFGYLNFECAPEHLEALTKTLGLSKDVLRFIIVVPPAPRKASTKRNPLRAAMTKPETAPAKSLLTNEALEEKLAAMESEVH